MVCAIDKLGVLSNYGWVAKIQLSLQWMDLLKLRFLPQRMLKVLNQRIKPLTRPWELGALRSTHHSNWVELCHPQKLQPAVLHSKVAWGVRRMEPWQRGLVVSQGTQLQLQGVEEQHQVTEKQWSVSIQQTVYHKHYIDGSSSQAKVVTVSIQRSKFYRNSHHYW